MYLKNCIYPLRTKQPICYGLFESQHEYCIWVNSEMSMTLSTARAHSHRDPASGCAVILAEQACFCVRM